MVCRSLWALCGTDGTPQYYSKLRILNQRSLPRGQVVLTMPLYHPAYLGYSRSTRVRGDQTAHFGQRFDSALAREKPTSSKTGAIRFLAQWLLENNPNKPRVVAAPGAEVEEVGAAGDLAAEASESQILRAQVCGQAVTLDMLYD